VFFFSFFFFLWKYVREVYTMSMGFLAVRLVKVKYSRQCFPIGQQQQTQEPVSCSTILIVGVE
jgi:hypothetical protein